MRSWAAVAFVLLALLPWRATTAGDTVSYEVGRETVRAYLARPSKATGSSASLAPPDVPGLVVLHEMWGLNDQIMGVADRLSRLGYVAIAPDMYRGRLGADPGLAQDMMRALNEDRAVSIAKGAIDYLRRLDNASGRPVGTVGFGMGGRISLATALQGANVQATVIFYGKVETTREALAPIKAPILGIFAGRDAVIPKDDVNKFEAALKASGKDALIVLNEGLGHGFMNEERADFEPEFSKDSWIRLRKWLGAKLMPGVPEEPAPAEQ